MRMAGEESELTNAATRLASDERGELLMMDWLLTTECDLRESNE